MCSKAEVQSITADSPLIRGCCPYISAQPTLTISISAESKSLWVEVPSPACLSLWSFLPSLPMHPFVLMPPNLHLGLVFCHKYAQSSSLWCRQSVLRLVPLAVCPNVGGGYDAFICQEFGYASAPSGEGETALFFFVLHHVPVNSACIVIVTQDRGTRVPPVKSSSICHRQPLRIGACQILEYASSTVPVPGLEPGAGFATGPGLEVGPGLEA